MDLMPPPLCPDSLAHVPWALKWFFFFNLYICPLLCLPQTGKGVAAFVSRLTPGCVCSFSYLSPWTEDLQLRSVVACSKRCSFVLKHPRISLSVWISESILESPFWAAGTPQAAFEEHGGCSSSLALPQCACLSSRWIMTDHLRCPFPGCDKICLRAVVRRIFVAICCYPGL